MSRDQEGWNIHEGRRRRSGRGTKEEKVNDLIIGSADLSMKRGGNGPVGAVPPKGTKAGMAVSYQSLRSALPLLPGPRTDPLTRKGHSPSPFNFSLAEQITRKSEAADVARPLAGLMVTRQAGRAQPSMVARVRRSVIRREQRKKKEPGKDAVIFP